MPPRMNYGLGFSLNPPACDIIREDQFIPDPNGNVVPLAKGQERVFKWVVNPYVKDKRKIKTELISVTILAVGTQTKLKEYKVSSQGVCVDGNDTDECVGTRSKELQKLRYLESHKCDSTLQAIAEECLNDGPDALCSHSMPYRNNLPQKRSADELGELDGLLKNLPCFSPGPQMVEILAGRGIYGNIVKVPLLRQEFHDQPERHFLELMKILLKPILGIPGISVRGKRFCAAVPEELIGFAFMYVLSVFVEMGGDRKSVTFNPHAKVAHLLDNARKKPKTTMTTATVTTATMTTAMMTTANNMTTATMTTASVTTAIITPATMTTATATITSNSSTTNMTPLLTQTIYNSPTSTDHSAYTRQSPSPTYTDISQSYVEVQVPFKKF